MTNVNIPANLQINPNPACHPRTSQSRGYSTYLSVSEEEQYARNKGNVQNTLKLIYASLNYGRRSKLQTASSLLKGHAECAEFLENMVADLPLNPAIQYAEAEELLLQEIDQVFTAADNNMLLAEPTKVEVEETINDSNLNAAPGTDGITSYLYKECWDVLGDPLTDVVTEIFQGNQPTSSQRTSLMVFGSKPKKATSIKPSDKRRISLCNSDFKTATGLEARRFKKVATHTLSPHQLVAGSDRRIHHGIARARDAIHATGKRKEGCGILDTDYIAAFDWMVMLWVFKVLSKKGLSDLVIRRLNNLYKENISIIVVNNILGRVLRNDRLSVRQGDIPSMTWFAYGIDPLLHYLDRRLTGITIHSLPALGPCEEDATPPPPIIEKYRVIGYADDMKPGKFMPLTQRPWSINTFCLSKVWYKSNVLDLRVADISTINSKVKSWLYSDQFEKPEELVLYRPTIMGGLNMHNVKHKSLSMLIRRFMETEANPNFLHSQ